MSSVSGRKTKVTFHRPLCATFLPCPQAFSRRSTSERSAPIRWWCFTVLSLALSIPTNSVFVFYDTGKQRKFCMCVGPLKGRQKNLPRTFRPRLPLGRSRGRQPTRHNRREPVAGHQVRPGLFFVASTTANEFPQDSASRNPTTSIPPSSRPGRSEPAVLSETLSLRLQGSRPAP